MACRNVPWHTTVMLTSNALWSNVRFELFSMCEIDGQISYIINCILLFILLYGNDSTSVLIG